MTHRTVNIDELLQEQLQGGLAAAENAVTAPGRTKLGTYFNLNLHFLVSLFVLYV